MHGKTHPLRKADLFVGGLWVLYLKVIEHNNGGRGEGTWILILRGSDGLEPSFTRTSMTMGVDKFRRNCPNSIHGNNYIPSLVCGHLFYSNVGAIHAGPQFILL